MVGELNFAAWLANIFELSLLLSSYYLYYLPLVLF